MKYFFLITYLKTVTAKENNMNIGPANCGDEEIAFALGKTVIALV